MDTFDKRDILLDRQIEMLEGKIKRNETLLALIHFENCCANGGLSHFAEDLEKYDLNIIETFAKEEKIETVENMVKTLKVFLEKYGKDFTDCLNGEEYEELTKYDDEFFNINDSYTDKLYERLKGTV